MASALLKPTAARRLPLWAGLLAVLVTLSALGAGLTLDDYGMLLTVRGGSRIYEYLSLSPLDLFRFFDGNPEDARQLMDIGLAPWWTYPQMKAAFWRPVTSLTHYIDFRFWGHLPWLMHLHSVLIYGSVAGLAAVLYRRWSGATWTAGLAAILYAVDHTHGTPAGWLANRNALLAALFGFLALWAHDRWRREAWRAGPFAATGALALSLLSGEAGIATCAYLFAHAVFLDREKMPKALLCLAPYAVTVVTWRVVWTALGYGTDGIGLYVDPLREPLAFLRALGGRAPLLLLAQWAVPPAETNVFLGPEGRRIHLLAAIVFLGVLTAVFHRILRRNRVGAFYLAGMLLALVPICTAFPHDRMLLFVGLGAMGLMGEIIREALGRPSRLWPKWCARVPAIGIAALLAVLHLVVSPPVLAFRAASPAGPRDELEKMFVLQPLEPGDAERDFVLVNPPVPFIAGGSLPTREARGLGLPRSIRSLAPGTAAVTIRRVDDRTLHIQPENGFCAGVFERLFRNETYRMRPGDLVELRGMTVEVTQVDSKGHPTEARFTFDRSLEDPRIQWLHWNGAGYAPFEPPVVGRQVELRSSYFPGTIRNRQDDVPEREL